ncbi:ribose 5-phosphate isomerase B [Clostridium sp. D2Q-14]|uniref:ribose 5-phosphate isomerase B n=1 Tax=Anaeromonas gelatinilytica TaxID=2683194 RepID=UPI00193BDF45|nr:ribose 5-phosphate isomerase B [Anaeromonas gelatinilytica]MBS4536453.1 ribose 5-phosphate isomerase B [Anaeromonas gelatinilytica]
MKIAVGSDHGGLELKEEIRKHLEDKGIPIKDFGTYSEDSVDYPDFGKKVSEAVAKGEYDKGIVVCGTGIGISIACNKVKGIRCALCSDTYSAKMASMHNNANVIALGGRVLGKDLAKEIVDSFLKAEFEGGRHERRVDKIIDIENNML